MKAILAILTLLASVGAPAAFAAPSNSVPSPSSASIWPAAPSPEERAAEPAPRARREKLKPARISDLYRRALGTWAGGDADAACAALMEVETSVVDDTDAASSKRLLRAEEAVIHEVAANDLEVLVPIARLHYEALRRYQARDVRGLALVQNHSRTMVHDLALLYREQSGSQGATLVASHLLTTLGELQQRSAQHQAAAELFTKAQQLDGRNIAAALSLGIIYEKFEQYRAAVNALRKVLAIEPNHAEARLRLAINLERVGRADEAREILESLAQGGRKPPADAPAAPPAPTAGEAQPAPAQPAQPAVAPPDGSWVTSLAFQQLAEIAEAKGSPAVAEKVLRIALGRFPESARLRIQLAAVLEREGKIRAGRAVMEKILELPPGGDDAARFRYNSTSADTFAVSRAFFDENARSRLQALAAALGGAPPAAGKQGGR